MRWLPGLITAFLLALTSLAQTPAPRIQVSGTVAAVDPPGNKLTLKSDKGDEVTVATTERTRILKIPPGETDTRKGAAIELSGIHPGDRAVVVAPQGSDPKALAATAVLVMSKSDVASLQQRDVEDWKKRGTTGNVSSIDSASRAVMILVGVRTMVVKPSEKTSYFRYSSDSARFADARPSTFDEIKSGDQLRVLGNKSEDGGTIAAEKIVSGSFRQIAATISAIDPAKGEITIKDLANKNSKDLITIKVVADTTMKKLSAPMAATLARRYAPGTQQPTQQAAPQPSGGRGAGGDIGAMLDGLPPLPLTDLKKGDAIMVSTTQGADATHATAIMLLAGVEPLLTASPTATRDIMSGWNISSGGEGQ